MEDSIQQPKKRGRKPKKDKYYFSEREENAVVDYINYNKKIEHTTKEILEMTFGCPFETLEEIYSGMSIYDMIEIANDVRVYDKNKSYKISVLKSELEEAKAENEKIYNNILEPVFHTMVESIMRRYNRYVPLETTGQTLNDAISYLITKVDKFDVTRNKKAYSYYGNICKNYITARKINFEKSLVRNPSYDDKNNDFNFTNDIKFCQSNDRTESIASEIISKLIARIKEMCAEPEKYSMKDSEVILGEALIVLLENWDYVISTDGSNKLNKNAILFFLRENTGLDTKGIRDNIKKFKKEFLLIKKYLIDF